MFFHPSRYPEEFLKSLHELLLPLFLPVWSFFSALGLLKIENNSPASACYVTVSLWHYTIQRPCLLYLELHYKCLSPEPQGQKVLKWLLNQSVSKISPPFSDISTFWLHPCGSEPTKPGAREKRTQKWLSLGGKAMKQSLKIKQACKRVGNCWGLNEKCPS